MTRQKPEVPQDKNIEEVKQVIEEHPRIDVGVDNSRGFEIKYASDAKEWLGNTVEKNSIRFDNPNRFDSGHPYVLILPENQ